MPDFSPIADPLKRRWYQYSVRTLFIFVTLVAVLLAWIIAPAERQRAAAHTIEGSGGKVEYAEIPLDESWFRRTLRKCLPRDYFDAVVKVEGDYSWSDSDLECLKPLSQLQSLNLSYETKLTDAGLVHLQGLTNLRELRLQNIPLTDTGLAHLQGLSKLQWLDLYKTRISDAGLSHLQGLTKLEGLELGETQVGDAGLEHLKGLKQLTYLDFPQTKVSDAGLEHLHDLSNLERLSLNNTRVTDAGLVHLQGLKKLHWLDLGNTEVSDTGGKILRQALPNCNVFVIGSK